MSVPAYPEYKDSGIPWLGEVPKHWDVVALKRLASLKSGEAITADAIDSEGNYPVYGGNGLRGYTNAYTHEGGFALIGRQGALCGNINYASGQFWASEHAIVVAPRRQFALNWLGELLRAMNLNQYSVAAAQPGLSAEALSNLSVPLPPSVEQTAIAAFLNRETVKIDALVTEQERLIALLKEKRQSVISHAVTRGLNPRAPMKDSGIEWLGEVPAHWEVMALKRLGSLRSGEAITSDQIEHQGEFPVYGGNGFRGYTSAYTHEGDYVLIGRQGALCGNINYAHGQFWASEHAIVVNPVGDYSVVWLGELLRHMNLGQHSQSAAQPGLSAEFLSHVYVPMPPIQEQDEIAALLAEKINQSDDLANQAQAAITLLQERRAALISAAVTGKIDVRGLMAPEDIDRADDLSVELSDQSGSSDKLERSFQ